MLRSFAGVVLRYEFYILAVIIAVFWFPDQRRVWALLLFIPLFAARYLLYRRLWKSTPLDPLLVAFLALCALNAFIAPYFFIAPDVGGLVMLGRPLMGMLLALSLVDRAYRVGTMDTVLFPTMLFALLVAVLALVSSQWTAKSSQLMFIIQWLPQVRNIPQIGFNVNEIAGAMAYLTPLMAGLAAYYWSVPVGEGHNRLFRWLSSIAFCGLWIATFLGQSRLAILGILPVLLIINLVLIRQPRWRKVALVFIVFFAVAQAVIFSGVFSTQADLLAARDEASMSSRLLIWQSGLEILRDYPLTGTGMNTFRAPPVRALYPVQSYETRVLPHAHNEWVQLGADLGVPGLLIILAIYGVIGWMLWRTWRHGDAKARAIALACGCGFAAHLFFAMGDAIPLWDRLAFTFWWLVGIGTAQYVVQFHVPQFIKKESTRVKSSQI